MIDRVSVIVRNRNFLLIKLAIAIVVFNLIAVYSKVTSAEDNQDNNSGSKLLNDWQIDSQPAEPRQYFKINVAPKKIQRSKQATEIINRHATGSSESSAISLTQEQQTPIMSGNVSKQKISNATLKKLLNQSSLKSLPTTASNSSSPTSSGSNKSNFKFVFIQRATAAPNLIKSQNSQISQQTSSSSSTSTQQPSLAASISRQLASSLLKSAVEIVTDNLDSARPSLSALASQLAASNAGSNSIVDTGSGINKKSDLEKYKQADIGTKKIQIGLADDQKSSAQTKTTKAKVKQPSKIYNLPVKFVSNGQPNHIVFSTIRQHFATIKKMQQAANQSANKGSLLSNQSLIKSNQQTNNGKRRKPQQHQKFKSNSRLIYLPLKYLSNARPNKIISTNNIKSVHRSSLPHSN